MSNYTILQDTTLELRRRIYDALDSAPDADFGLSNPESDITLSPPRDQMQGNPHLSLYLYRIDQDGHLRNQPWLPDQQTGLRYPPMPIKLCYLITPLEREEDQNQLMLGRIIQRFHDQPVLESLGGTPLDNSHGGNSPEMRITFEALSMEELSHIWNALRTNYRLSTAYSVHVVTVDSAQAIAEAKRVVSAHTVVGVKE
ncbi:MAG: DUF4255 domain-containing protein [Anaerolineae bacterium]|jgi:hypothetical protein